MHMLASSSLLAFHLTCSFCVKPVYDANRSLYLSRRIFSGTSRTKHASEFGSTSVELIGQVDRDQFQRKELTFVVALRHKVVGMPEVELGFGAGSVKFTKPK
ncbi:unnamed protein product [Protopolystoma xenopodis]|uniref:Uncharacterized protein n=1 Tax=Protopolystoma xenopodis TaxID=117903 RepID=A0A448WRG1_9PLAT|nr:unnamed protein product [Protopolystoma xenopodis]